MNKVTRVISKLNIFEDKISLGYPLLIKRGSKRHSCKPIMVLNVLKTLMNKSTVRLLNGQMFESKQTVESYCHVLRLLLHFIDKYPELGEIIK
ncbi:unnamed protein product [Adineta steineri]|uniref:Uncharacterized protein n=1 Tax=Adineta steineri TaxID=433720 RepID=A0A814J1X2_9BILA|nr:unnamed protein product [Adineta steineri]CAF1031561.1 unnamed protein product [Adineta steineri]CAF3998816.1 unnamed protein product [Adineta steineri]CAF4020089.1 unnamed protein product [Adineta steineri]